MPYALAQAAFFPDHEHLEVWTHVHSFPSYEYFAHLTSRNSSASSVVGRLSLSSESARNHFRLALRLANRLQNSRQPFQHLTRQFFCSLHFHLTVSQADDIVMAPRPSAAEVAGASKMQLTSNDNELLTSLFAHAKSAPDVDWDKVGGDLGLKDGKNARQRFTRLCTKMGWSATGSGGSAGATTTDASLATPATPGDSPAKVTKRKGRVGTKGGAKAKKVMASEDDDEEEDVNMADIPETPAAKSKAKAKAAKKPAQKKEGAVKEEEQSDEDKKNFKDSDDDEEKLDSKGSPASYHDEV